MVICGRLLIKLYLPNCHSLKEKRSVLKSILAKTQHQFNVSSAEVDFQDVWQSALLGFTTISNDAVMVTNTLHKIVQFIEDNWPDASLMEQQIDLF
jgi:uncharacterized protein YlxP (DUF503 family)